MGSRKQDGHGPDCDRFACSRALGCMASSHGHREAHPTWGPACVGQPLSLHTSSQPHAGPEVHAAPILVACTPPHESIKHMGPPYTSVPETYPHLGARELPFKMQIPLHHSLIKILQGPPTARGGRKGRGKARLLPGSWHLPGQGGPPSSHTGHPAAPSPCPPPHPVASLHLVDSDESPSACVLQEGSPDPSMRSGTLPCALMACPPLLQTQIVVYSCTLAQWLSLSCICPLPQTVS